MSRPPAIRIEYLLGKADNGLEIRLVRDMSVDSLGWCIYRKDPRSDTGYAEKFAGLTSDMIEAAARAVAAHK